MISGRILSLFCGAGGLDLGFRQAGFQTLLAIDKNPIAVETYNRNHAQSKRVACEGDLAVLTSKDIVRLWSAVSGEPPLGIIGGPPCQAFSQSNVHKKANDSRAALVFHYAEIVRAFNAKFGLGFFVFENVAGLSSRRHQPLFDKLINELTSAGFEVHADVLNAQRYGVPQARRRRFIVGLNHGVLTETAFTFPPGTERTLSVRQAIGALADPILFERGLDAKTFPVHPNHWSMNPRSPKFENGQLSASTNRGRSFRVLAWDKPSPTVAYGNREVHVHPSGKRRLSVYEALILQGFPKRYVLTGTLSDQIRLVSDAVPPPMALALAKRIRRAIRAKPPKARLSRQTSDKPR